MQQPVLQPGLVLVALVPRLQEQVLLLVLPLVLLLVLLLLLGLQKRQLLLQC
jgi:hypothetical protein